MCRKSTLEIRKSRNKLVHVVPTYFKIKITTNRHNDVCLLLATVAVVIKRNDFRTFHMNFSWCTIFPSKQFSTRYERHSFIVTFGLPGLRLDLLFFRVLFLYLFEIVAFVSCISCISCMFFIFCSIS